jgi:transcription antitermination factor NusG
VKERHRWSDRWREVECPLFPGYLFARATNADWHQILRTRGVRTVVKERGKPALLADSFVTSLRNAIEREGAASEAVTESVDYTSGDEVIAPCCQCLSIQNKLTRIRWRMYTNPNIWLLDDNPQR